MYFMTNDMSRDYINNDNKNLKTMLIAMTVISKIILIILIVQGISIKVYRMKDFWHINFFMNDFHFVKMKQLILKIFIKQ